MGHPSGLPMKIAGGSKVHALEKHYFVANLDTFTGNSGSPVLNEKTGLVEGILVRGGKDYIFDFDEGCYYVNKCEPTPNKEISGCGGEHISFITELISALP